MIQQARYGSYCSLLTSFCKEASKNDGIYEQVMDDIIKLQKKYCGNDDNGRQNSEVGDPLPIPGKGAPKKKKNEPKSVRRCGKCNNPSHNARTCSVIAINHDLFVS
jgi:hypothetical protein